MDNYNYSSFEVNKNHRNKLISLKKNLLYNLCVSLQKNSFKKCLYRMKNKEIYLKIKEMINYSHNIENLILNLQSQNIGIQS